MEVILLMMQFERGAKVIISEKKLKKKNNIVFLTSKNVRKLLAEVSYKFSKKKNQKT